MATRKKRGHLPAPAQGSRTLRDRESGDRSARRRSSGTRSAGDAVSETVDDFILRLQGRYGSTENALRHLATEVRKYRIRAQNAESRAEELEDETLPEGAVILEGDEATTYNQLKKDKPEFSLKGLGDVLKEHGELKKSEAVRKRDTDLATAAGTTYNKKLLAKILGDTAIEFKKGFVKGENDKMEEVQLPYVKHGDTLMALEDYLNTEHKEIIDVLMKVEASTDSTTQEPRTTITGSSMPKQPPASNGNGPKGGDKAIMVQVEKSLSTHMSPSAFRKMTSGAPAR